MAILISQLANTGAYTLSSDDAVNKFVGLSTIAETLNFSGTGSLEILDVSNGDVLNLTGIDTSETINIKKSGNNVILTAGTQTFTLGALADGETVTVNLGTGGRIPPLTISRTGESFSYGDGDIVEGDGTDLTLTIAAPTSLVEFNSTKLADDFLNDAEAASITFRATLASAAVAGDTVQLLSGTDVIKTSAVLAGGETTVDFAIVKADLGIDESKTLTVKITDGTNISAASPALNFELDTTAPTAPSTVTLTSVGGNVVANTLNNTNTQLTATATITAVQATDGSAILKIAGTIVATDSTIAAGDTTLNFTLAGNTPTAAELQSLISAGGLATVELTDLAGNTSVSTVSNPTLVVDYTPTALTIPNGVALSADTGSSNTDFITNEATQTITATLSDDLAVGDELLGSFNDGANWIDITNKAAGIAISWDGVTLTAGTSAILLKIVDAQGNEKEISNQAYTLDTDAPAAPTFALKTDTGTSSSDGVSTDGTITVIVPNGGFETGASWQYSTDSVNWSTLQETSVTEFTLPEATYATGYVKVRQVDVAGNGSTTPATNASVLKIDNTAPTQPTITANLAVKGGVSLATGFTLGTNERIWLAPSADTAPTSTSAVAAATLQNSTSASITAPTTAGTYKFYHEDAAGNISPAADHLVYVDDTTPTSTITGISFIQKFGSDENVIRLTGTNFNSILTGTESGSTDLKTYFDFTKLTWNVDGLTTQAISIDDIEKVNAVSATQLDIILKSTNALYSNEDFLTADSVTDTVVISAGFIQDKAGNTATTDALSSTLVNTSTVYAMTLTGNSETDTPTIYVPNVELTAPDTGNAIFDGTNLKAKPTVTLSVASIKTDQTITLTNLQSMDYVTDQNTISFSSTADPATTEKVVIDLTDAKSLTITNTTSINTQIAFMGGGSYASLGDGIDVIELNTATLMPAVGSLTIDSIENFTSGTDKVNILKSAFSAFTSNTLGVLDGNGSDGDVKVSVGSTTPATIDAINLWVNDGDGVISYDEDGDWTTGSVQLISILTTAGAGVLASDLYLV